MWNRISSDSSDSSDSFEITGSSSSFVPCKGVSGSVPFFNLGAVCELLLLNSRLVGVGGG